MKGLVSALGAMGAEERQLLGLLERRREGSPSTSLSQSRWTTTACLRRRRLRHAALAGEEITAPVDVQPVAPLPELVNSRAFSLEA